MQQVKFKEEARKGMIEGIDIGGSILELSIGPQGGNVAVDKGYGTPDLGNDGLKSLEHLNELQDRFQQMGLEFMKALLIRMNDIAKDGRKTAALTYRAIIQEASKNIVHVDVNEVKRGISFASQTACNELELISRPIKTREDSKHIASISSESPELGEIIADVIEAIGKDGVIRIEESGTSEMMPAKIVQGMELDRGYVADFMVTSNDEKEAEMKSPPILITTSKITSIQDLIPIMGEIKEKLKVNNLFIVAEDYDYDVLQFLRLNKRLKEFNVVAIKAPGYGQKKVELLSDLATITGATLLTDEGMVSLSKFTVDTLGKAGHVVCTPSKTIVFGGKGTKKDIDAKIQEIKDLRKQEKSKFEIDGLTQRIAKLSGGIAIIPIGASSVKELQYLRDKINDSFYATKWAKEEGIVPGGGVALIKAAVQLQFEWDIYQEDKNVPRYTPGFELGYLSFMKAIESPFRHILSNSGHNDASVYIERIKKSKTGGFDAKKNVWVDDVFKSGIVDALKVTKMAISNAAADAAMFLTTKVAISLEKDEIK